MRSKDIVLWIGLALSATILAVVIGLSLIPTTTPIGIHTFTPEQLDSMSCDEIASQAKTWLGTGTGQYGAYVELAEHRGCN
jgi:hypothetical protein